MPVLITASPLPTPAPLRDAPGIAGWVSRLLEHPDRYGTLARAEGPHQLLAWGPPAVVVAAILFLVWVALARWVARRRLALLWRDARLISVIPPPEVEAAGGVAFWANLVGLLRPALKRALSGQPHVAFEYIWDTRGARLQLWVPGVIPPGLIERALEAAWPGTHTLARPATTALTAAPVPILDAATGRELAATGGTLRLARTEVLPLAIDHDTDPLRALFSAASGLHPNQHAAVQILARPTTGTRLRRTRRAMRHLRLGSPASPLTGLLDVLTPGPSGRSGTSRAGRAARTPADPERAAQIRAAVTKAATPSWEVLVRYALSDTTPSADPGAGQDFLHGVAPSSAEDRRVRRQLREVLRGRAHALASAFALYSGHNFLTRRRLRHPARVLAHRAMPGARGLLGYGVLPGRAGGDVYGVPELAALAHLPLDAATPGLARAGARAVAPPPEIATSPSPRRLPAALLPGAVAGADDPPGTEEPVDADEAGQAIKTLGDTDTGVPRQAGVRVADARHHLHVIGATGSGKSTLMLHNILDDVNHGRGVVVIDPKGDLVLDLLDRLPASAGRRLALIDPDDQAPPPCLNPLDLSPGEDMDTAVDNLVGIFRRIFSGFWGPRTDDVLRAASLTLLRAPRHTLAAAERTYARPGIETDPQPTRAASAGSVIPTLAHIPRLLDDETYRHTLTAGITDEVLAGFWAWYDRLGDAQRANAVGPVLNKLRAFLLRSFVRDAIAAGPASIDMSRALDGGIALVRLPKGVLGEETARLLGSFVVARTWQAASARARAGKPRIDSSLYIDEAHNFLNLPYPIEDMLAEARGYRLSMIVAHQNLAQMPREMREGVSANARNKIIFNASPEDARDLERHTQPTLTAHDLSHLGAFQAAVRLVARSADAPAFTLRTRPIPRPAQGRAGHLRAAANSPATSTPVSTGRDPHANGPAAGTTASTGRPLPISARRDARLQFTEPVPTAEDPADVAP